MTKGTNMKMLGLILCTIGFFTLMGGSIMSIVAGNIESDVLATDIQFLGLIIVVLGFTFRLGDLEGKV